MIEPPLPADEPYRLAALHALSLLDSPREPDFDIIVELGRSLFAVPTCLVSLIDTDRQWFKASVGLQPAETPRAISFCGHAILQPDVFVVPDATKDERFHDNPLVTGAPFIRFYAGAPIRLPSGYTIGTVCILGPVPRADFDTAQRKQLARLAELAITAISLRALRDQLDHARQDAERQQAAMAAIPLPIALADAQGRLSFANDAFNDLCNGRAFPGIATAEALQLADSDWEQACGTGQLALPDGRILAIHGDGDGFALTAAAATHR